jgi:hypothetical protein
MEEMRFTYHEVKCDFYYTVAYLLKARTVKPTETAVDR